MILSSATDSVKWWPQIAEQEGYIEREGFRCISGTLPDALVLLARKEPTVFNGFRWVDRSLMTERKL